MTFRSIDHSSEVTVTFDQPFELRPPVSGEDDRIGVIAFGLAERMTSIERQLDRIEKAQESGVSDMTPAPDHTWLEKYLTEFFSLLNAYFSADRPPHQIDVALSHDSPDWHLGLVYTKIFCLVVITAAIVTLCVFAVLKYG